MASRPLFSTLLVVLVLGLTACRDDHVASYTVPKEKDPELPMAAGDAQAPADSQAGSPGAAMPPGPMAGADAGGAAAAGSPMAATPVQTASGAPLVWTAPAAWKPKAGSMMRKGSYEVPPGAAGAAPGDLSITAFPGDVGGEVANVNRWRSQVGLQALAPDAASGCLDRLQINGLAMGVLDVSAAPSAGDHRILGAIVPYAGSTWFFKLSGPNATLEAAKPAFLEFLKSVRVP